MKKIYIYDLDDTLIVCQKFYTQVVLKFTEKLIDVLGESPPYAHEITAKQDQINKEVLSEKSWSKFSFANSLVFTYEHFATAYGLNIEHQLVKQFYEMGTSIFTAKYPIKKGTKETLTELKRQGAILIMLTMGDKRVQQAKIKTTGLGELFDEIHIVPGRKTARKLGAIMKPYMDQGFVKSDMCMVGDSIYNDMLPANKFGITAFKVPHNCVLGGGACRGVRINNLLELLDPRTYEKVEEAI